MTPSQIAIRGCRVHNLKEVDIDIPRGKLIAVCGVSGSGKTSLALDTLYAEGQRCYIESFSAYTRQFLQRLDKPDCDSIEGIPPAIAVTRASGSRTNRSTVGTSTEIADYCRLLYSKASDLICYQCGEPVQSEDPELIAQQLTELDSKAMIGFQVWLPDRKSASEILLGLQQDGYVRLVVDGTTYHLSDSDRSGLASKVGRKGTEAFVVVDRVSSGADASRLTESLETAMSEGLGRAVVLIESERETDQETDIRTVEIDQRNWAQRVISRDRRCDQCDLDFPDPVPRLFNFNNPLGACPNCEGFGETVDYDMDLVVPDPSLTLAEGAIAPWTTPAYRHELDELLDLAADYDIPTDIPFRKIKKKHRKLIHDGVPERDFGGLQGFFRWLERKKYKMHVRVFASRYKSYRICEVCDGKRFKPETLSYRVGGKSISELLSMQAHEATEFLGNLQLQARAAEIASEPLRQISDRIGYLEQVGLGYLQLDRTLRTLSGGEIQRVSLTTALGSNLVNTLYVLDEPTAGLHPSDVQRLVDAVVGLRDRGNTVIVVEHNHTMIQAADQVIEIGPGAGTEGGHVTFQGKVNDLLKNADSLTGQFLSGRRGWSLTDRQPRARRGAIALQGASGHNLKNIDVHFPLGVLCLVTGISGSGKSTLVQDTLFPAIKEQLGSNSEKPLPFKSIAGVGEIDDCLLVDQSPISRSARSCPVTYVKAFDAIRKVFAETVEARTRNLDPGHFSFNSAKGQCPECEGAGVLEIDMQFLANVTMQCPTCRGSRYRDPILDVRYRDRSIAEVLEMTAIAAHQFFRGYDRVQSRLRRLIDVGLEYVTLGQPATTLSSGEGQRLKLAAFLASSARRRTLFIMDEPTTGLHFADIVRLTDCFEALIADGHSLLVVEHHPMMMEAADHIIDLGPGAAGLGGEVVVAGTPEQVAKHDTSQTAAAIRERMIARNDSSTV